MAVVKHTDADIALLARLLRVEGEGEGDQGMLMIGNVGVNRIRSNCSDFEDDSRHDLSGACLLRLYRRGIFISGQETGKRGLHAVA